MHGLPVMFKTSDQIFPASPRGSGVEESRVFIPFDSNPEVETLPPVSQLLRMDVLEALGRESTQLCLAIGKRMFFFQKIQRSNEVLVSLARSSSGRCRRAQALQARLQFLRRLVKEAAVAPLKCADRTEFKMAEKAGLRS